MKSLLIYNFIPDDTFYYELNHDDPILPLVRTCHNIFVNGQDLTEEQANAYNQLDGEQSLLRDKEKIDPQSTMDQTYQGVYIINFMC